MSDKHTPPPWRLHGDDARRILRDNPFTVDDDVAVERARCGYEGRTDPEADAHHIVRCVNAHEALVEALEVIATWGMDVTAGTLRPRSAIDNAAFTACDTLERLGLDDGIRRARKALAAAKGE